MRTIHATLVLGLLALMSGFSQAADLYGERGPAVARGAAPYDMRVRVVEQLPYCGDCEAPLGHVRSSTVHLRYVGWPAWERGCLFGNCYGYYYSIDSCYFKDAPVRNARGRWVHGIREFCD